MRPPITIAIAACNEQEKIAATLESAKACSWCDELLVYDSGSTDQTIEIAKQYEARVEFHEWINYAASKKNMVMGAKNDWVLVLDADEQISDALRDEIEALTEDDFRNHPVMHMPRRNYILGRYVKAWDPDVQNRLIDRTRTHWPDRAVHEERIPTEGSIKKLKGHLLHNATTDQWGDYFDGPRFSARTDALAREMFDHGKRIGWFQLMFRPWVTFLKYYLLKGGFVQGTFGLIIAQKAAFSVQLKYAKLWYLQQQERQPQSRVQGQLKNPEAEDE